MARPSDVDATVAARRGWMSILAHSDEATLEHKWGALMSGGHIGTPRIQYLRRPETGLVMVRTRAGGTGARFNLTEVTVTRCTVKVTMNGTLPAMVAIGTAYVMGRSQRHAELAALFDALLQIPNMRARIEADVIGPIAQMQAKARQARAEKVAATRVDFLTMAEGEYA